MEKRKLGDSGLEVSICCLGTMTYGSQTPKEDAFNQMDLALEKGVNFFDTAELYAIPPSAPLAGKTETIIGEYFKERKNRDKVILASKVAGRAPLAFLRDGENETRLNESQIDYAIEHSLRKLQTDYIDLYQLHWPDRRTQIFGGFAYEFYEGEYIAFEETLRVLEKHRKKGNIRHFGLSNETPWGVMRFLEESEKANLFRPVSIQNAYHLLNRNFELGLAEIAHREGVGLLAYSPLGQGYLTGKYLGGARPEGARSTLFNRGQRYETPSAEKMIGEYVNLAVEFGLTPVQMALKFCATRSFVTSVIIGATNIEQLQHELTAFDVEFPKELLNKINYLYSTCPNPCP